MDERVCEDASGECALNLFNANCARLYACFVAYKSTAVSRASPCDAPLLDRASAANSVLTAPKVDFWLPIALFSVFLSNLFSSPLIAVSRVTVASASFPGVVILTVAELADLSPLVTLLESGVTVMDKAGSTVFCLGLLRGTKTLELIELS